jgi:hypothetical protein
MRRAPALVLLVGLLVAACGGTTPSGASGPTAASTAPVTSGPASGGPDASPAASQAPGASPVDTSSPAPGSSDVPPESPGPSSSLSGSGSADVCTGSADNKAFYAQLASSVSWDVYCAVLPKGWVVSSGEYRLANGGKLTITYKGPDGTTLSLSEGSFCTDGTGCAPSGSGAGAATFGDMSGELVATDSGGYAVVVAQGQQPSWLMVTSGLDEATSISLGAALAKVAR